MKHFMYLKILFLLFFCCTMHAQEDCHPRPILNMSTGFDEHSGTLLSPGSLDQNWRLINMPFLNVSGFPVLANSYYSNITLGRAYVINRYYPNWCNNHLGEEMPISARNSPDFAVNNYTTNLPFRFVREFCLKEEDEILFDLYLKGDDAARISLYDENNVAIFQYTTVNEYANNFTLNSSWNFGDFPALNGWNLNNVYPLRPGAYTLEIELVNSNRRAMGVTLSGTISSMHQREILVNDTGCCDVGTVGLVKIIDENCNDELDQGEGVQPNVQFELSNGSGYFQSATTDANGEIIFRNVPFGTYNLREIVPAGYTSNNPSRIVTINPNEQSQYFYFFNCPETNTNDGAYCCPGEENMITNGNFEAGNVGFTSQYTYNSSVLPGQYDVTTNTALFNTVVNDHSYCEDPITYATNDQFMVVNGRTTQASGTETLIWSQWVGNLDVESDYKLCLNVKNLPQCNFDVLPKIRIKIGNWNNSTYTVNTTNDPCDWQNINFCFKPDSPEMQIEIYIDESGLGDGNDLAIDDISLTKKLEMDVDITVVHQSATHQILASIYSALSTDDTLPIEPDLCEQGPDYYWVVAEVSGFSGGNFTINSSAPIGIGTDTGNYNTSTGSHPNPWYLSTLFPDYVFEQNKMYLVGLVIPSCCESCYAESFTYQLTFNFQNRQNLSDKNTTLDKESRELIMSLLDKLNEPSRIEPIDSVELKEEMLLMSPNPADEMVRLELMESNIQNVLISDLSGNVVVQNSYNKSKVEIHISNLKPGVYLVTVITDKGEAIEKKLIIE